MPVRMSFDISWSYPDRAEGISIPTALINVDKIVRTYGKIDTGAECCIFSREIAVELGIDVETGLKKTLDSLTGTLDVFGHEVTIQTFDLAFQSVVYFAKFPGLTRNLLGRNGWLRHVRLAIVDYDNTLHLSKYDS